MNVNYGENNSSLDINQKNTKILPKININYLTYLNKNNNNSIRLIKKKQPYKNNLFTFIKIINFN